MKEDTVLARIAELEAKLEEWRVLELQEQSNTEDWEREHVERSRVAWIERARQTAIKLDAALARIAELETK